MTKRIYSNSDHPSMMSAHDDDDDDDDAHHVISILPHLTVSEFFNLGQHNSLGSTTTTTTTTTTTNPGEDTPDSCCCIGLVWIDASWSSNNCRSSSSSSLDPAVHGAMRGWIASATKGLNAKIITASLQICEQTDPDGYDTFIDEQPQHQIAPSQFPVLAVVARTPSTTTANTTIRYLKQITSTQLLRRQRNDDDDNEEIAKAVRGAIYDLEEQLSLPIEPSATEAAVRIFVAGDRSSVGKSSICLGILGTLLQAYKAVDLAYIKPATQDESTQLIQVFCQQHAIKCVPIGPLVYYRGFTRAFLAGETVSSAEWLSLCGTAVDRVARNKRVVLVDGVGFPAVGSICGTDNAQVATACGYSHNGSGEIPRPMGVVLVGGSGVGSAVDGYNLNKAYFERSHVPVLGAIFNKLAMDGFYSLENCREQVTKYFDLTQQQQKPFGFVPLFPQLAGPKGIQHAQEFIDLFQRHVDVQAIYDAAVAIQNSGSTAAVHQQQHQQTTTPHSPSKKMRPADREERRAHYKGLPLKSREDIERVAIHSGAPPSA